MSRVLPRLEFHLGLVFQHQGQSPSQSVVLLHQSLVLRDRNLGELGAAWVEETPVRLTFQHRGSQNLALPLPQKLPKPDADWWNRTTVRDGNTVTHYYRDRQERVQFILCRGCYYRL